MAAESGRLLAGQGKRKGRPQFHPSPKQIGIIHYCAAATGCTGAVSNCRPPCVTFTVSAVAAAPRRVDLCSILLWVYLQLRFLVLMSQSFPVLLIDLTSSVCGPSPCLGHWVRRVICGSGLHNLVMRTPGCSAFCPHASQSMSHHWIHFNLLDSKRSARSKAAPLCH